MVHEPYDPNQPVCTSCGSSNIDAFEEDGQKKFCCLECGFEGTLQG